MVFFIYCSVRDLLVCLPALKVWSVHCHYFSTLCIPNKHLLSKCRAGQPRHDSRHHVIDAKTKIRRMRRCREFFKNDSSGDATKICRDISEVGCTLLLPSHHISRLLSPPRPQHSVWPSAIRLETWSGNLPPPLPPIVPLPLSWDFLCVSALAGNWIELWGVGSVRTPSPILHIPRFISGGGGRGP